MGYRTISVILSDKDIDLHALLTARDIAAREEAHLDVQCIGVDPVRYDPMPAGSAAVILETGLAEARARAQELEEWAKDVLGYGPETAKVAITDVVIPQMGLDTLVARLARYSDLVVATQPYGAGRTPLQVNILEAELFGTGGPVLVVPAGKTAGAAPFKRVSVAWNETSESFTAIRAALPVLKAADKVDIVMIDPPSHSPERSDPGGAICMMLSRHGVNAEVAILSRTMPKISDVITRFATESGSDLIVMGAYGHSRFRESILGGATRDMLENAPLPLMMAH